MVKHLFYPHFSFLADRTTVLIQSLLCDRLAFVCLSVCLSLFWSKRTHTSITGILSSDSCI